MGFFYSEMAKFLGIPMTLCKQKLKEKAAFRNPDEFYFKMINSKTVGGVHKQA